MVHYPTVQGQIVHAGLADKLLICRYNSEARGLIMSSFWHLEPDNRS
jgi:hypothetical protein